MNFNKFTTALHFLEDNNPRKFKSRFQDELDLQPEMRVANFMRQDFDALRPDFASNVFYTSEPFLESFHKRRWSVREVPPPPMEDAIKGTWIAKTDNGYTQTVFFNLRYKEYPSGVLSFKGTVIEMLTHPDKRFPVLGYLIHSGKCRITSEKILKLLPMNSTRIIRHLYLLSYYVKNCAIEVKTMGSGTAGSPSVSMGDYRNGTHLPINIVDTTWNTTYVQEKDCTVCAKTGGFYRNQPYGQGLALRRLQWIPSFKRRGYVREARALRHRERSDGRRLSDRRDPS